MIGLVLSPGELTDAQRTSLEDVVRVWLEQRGGRGLSKDLVAAGTSGGVVPVEILTVEFLGEIAPTGEESGETASTVAPTPLSTATRGHRLVDVIADVAGRTAHVVIGLRRPGEETHPFRPGDDPVLGLFDHGVLGVAVDAVRDAELATRLVAILTGDEGPAPFGPSLIADDDEATVLSFGDRSTLQVFPWPGEDPHPVVAMLAALDEAGYNHVAPPLALWRRDGRDLGVVQEQLSGAADGWALALTSLRDLYGAGGPPEAAGGDFASEARALGTMTARMHLALDKAFGRQNGAIRDWVKAAGAAVRQGSPLLDDASNIQEALVELEASDLRAPAIRTHGDFHLGRTARTDQGWIVTDCAPGGVVPGATRPEPRSPLADVADMLWSLHHVAAVAASERDPSGRGGLAPLAHAWETRNRRSFLAGYLATPGIGGLVPSDREMVRKLAAVFELERATGGGIVLPPAP